MIFLVEELWNYISLKSCPNFSSKYTPWSGEIMAENQKNIELQKLTYIFT